MTAACCALLRLTYLACSQLLAGHSLLEPHPAGASAHPAAGRRSGRCRSGTTGACAIGRERSGTHPYSHQPQQWHSKHPQGGIVCRFQCIASTAVEQHPGVPAASASSSGFGRLATAQHGGLLQCMPLTAGAAVPGSSPNRSQCHAYLQHCSPRPPGKVALAALPAGRQARRCCCLHMWPSCLGYDPVPHMSNASG